jgi:hypothetical protein
MRLCPTLWVALGLAALCAAQAAYAGPYGAIDPIHSNNGDAFTNEFYDNTEDYGGGWAGSEAIHGNVVYAYIC